MTEFGRTPFFTAHEFQEMGYKMIIWPASALRVAAKAQEELYAAIRCDGGTHNMVDRMQTRTELYALIRYHDYEALDASSREESVTRMNEAQGVFRRELSRMAAQQAPIIPPLKGEVGEQSEPGGVDFTSPQPALGVAETSESPRVW